METRGKLIDFKALTRTFAVGTSQSRKMRSQVGNLSAARLQKKRLGDRVGNMKEDRKRKRCETQNAYEDVRVRKKKRTIAGKVVASGSAESDVNADAYNYIHNFNSKTCLWVCGVCGGEEGESDLKLLDDVLQVVENSDMSNLYTQVCAYFLPSQKIIPFPKSHFWRLFVRYATHWQARVTGRDIQ